MSQLTSIVTDKGMINPGDLVTYRKYGKEMKAYVVGYQESTDQLVIKKTKETNDFIDPLQVEEVEKQ